MLFSPGTVIANDLPQQEADAQPVTPPETQVQADPAAPPPAQPQVVDAKAILDAINKDREAREAKTREDSERESYKKRLDDAESKLADIEKAKKNRLLDPAGFLKKLGYTEKELAMTAEGIMFSLMPDKAPPAHVANLVRAQREQDLADAEEREKQRDAAAKVKETESAAESQRQMQMSYVASLYNDAKSFNPGTYPASQAWFAEDHEAYAQELFDTARKLAVEAKTTGAKPDISASGVAPILEKKYMEKLQKFLQVRTSQSLNTTQTQTQVQATPFQVTPALPDKQTGKKITDKELIDRATRAAFGRV